FEFKYDGKVEKALLQIDEKGYTIPYECDGREIVKIAVNFNSELRTIDEWRIE
ncbi:MAG: PD-(D/E)XK nuclease domain-containing protein, partial [Marinilabiliaceae bacterium]|nr:PD-(D/E)XK nuclease domain-containing protein [Marinilabiliaceae bacterium]